MFSLLHATLLHNMPQGNVSAHEAGMAHLHIFQKLLSVIAIFSSTDFILNTSKSSWCFDLLSQCFR